MELRNLPLNMSKAAEAATLNVGSQTESISGLKHAERPLSKRMRWKLASARLSWTALLLAITAVSIAPVEARNTVSNGLSSRLVVVYVSDFDLPSNAITSEGLFAELPRHRRREQEKAQSLVGLMGDAIVDDLAKAGIEAHRLPYGSRLPRNGWLVRGAFQKVDDGNRVSRAVVGFGAGHTDLQVAVSIDDLSAIGNKAHLYTSQTSARSGKMPGAIITANPYVAAAKFVLSGRDLAKQTEQSALKISDEIAAHMKPS